jgi:glycerophosphoryl diester phosphodiesterase
MTRAPAWLTARPIAHRGLHDRAAGIVENMPGAMRAAIAGSYAIETDVQLTADGEAMVHHDDALGRLNEGDSAVITLTSAALKQVTFRDTAERMMTLGELCDLVDGRVPLVVELKSGFDGNRAIVDRVATVLTAYRGPVAVMSFDPDKVLAAREIMPAMVRGIIAESRYDESEWPMLTPAQRHEMIALRHLPNTQPHFVSYNVNDLPSDDALAAKRAGCALITWTIRTETQRALSERYADQMTFEGFRP